MLVGGVQKSRVAPNIAKVPDSTLQAGIDQIYEDFGSEAVKRLAGRFRIIK